ncbi:MAG TPA: DUF2071 domain-containing protein, partial [Pyrinomonadaceae bacterium]|nr:DUF2071 domain-containing protein [Pyrinomonadaceae bacterium]
MEQEVHLQDRVAARRRPEGTPVMYQSWGSLLFMHWPTSPDVLRPLIPPGLEIDTFEDDAWVAVTPFTLWDVRPTFVPPLPYLSAFHEINVRTYVHCDGVPGVWFFSLDASRLAAVLGARLLYKLPYFDADIEFDPARSPLDYKMKRAGPPPASFDAVWEVEGDSTHAVPGSLEFFLVERYCLYTSDENDLYRCWIHHEAWPLYPA